MLMSVPTAGISKGTELIPICMDESVCTIIFYYMIYIYSFLKFMDTLKHTISDQFLQDNELQTEGILNSTK